MSNYKDKSNGSIAKLWGEETFTGWGGGGGGGGRNPTVPLPLCEILSGPVHS